MADCPHTSTMNDETVRCELDATHEQRHRGTEAVGTGRIWSPAHCNDPDPACDVRGVYGRRCDYRKGHSGKHMNPRGFYKLPRSDARHA